MKNRRELILTTVTAFLLAPSVDAMAQTAPADKPHKAGLFDIRNIIGALMAIYGVILTLAGLLGEHEPEKTGVPFSDTSATVSRPSITRSAALPS